MSVKVAIMADDLTGALDTAAPFAMAGLRVAVAVRPSAIAEARAERADVIAVNTVSRALTAAEAAKVVAATVRVLRDEVPEIVFKKIDSRLKGNVRIEIDAAASGFGLSEIVVAPAVPDQGRFTRGGAVIGLGVAESLPIGPSVPANADVVDADCDADLGRLAAERDWSRTLAVGARGLGIALAERYGPLRTGSFSPSRQTLFIIGSRDPITDAQVERLAGLAVICEVSGEDGAPLVAQLPAVLRDSGSTADPAASIARLLSAARPAIDALLPDTLVTSGGDTSLALLDALGASVVFPEGEASPGLPWFMIRRDGRPPMRAVVKSGGFGHAGTLASLLAG